MNPIRDTIGYADESWNVITGCRHGCPYCYARRIAQNLQRRATLGDDCTQPGGGLHEIRYRRGAAADSYRYGFEPTFHSHRLGEPGRRRKSEVIFVSDMGDLFGEWVPSEWIDQVLQVIRDCPWHSFLLLTKNSRRYGEFSLPENCWAGTTYTGPADERRIWDLPLTTHPNLWVSYEPSLGPYPRMWAGGYIRWIVVGAQSGSGAVAPRPEWIRDLLDARDQMGDEGAKVFFKDNLVWPEPRPRERPEGLVIGR